MQWLFISPLLLYPSCLHTTLASFSLQLLSQTVFHSPDWQISTRPSFAKLPPASLMAPSQQWKSLLVKTVARQIKNNDCHQICTICLTYCELQYCKRALNSNKSTVMTAPCTFLFQQYPMDLLVYRYIYMHACIHVYAKWPVAYKCFGLQIETSSCMYNKSLD